MNKLLATNPNNWTALIIRLALAVVIFPHGAQKLFGWFGGYGYEGTMGFLTGTAGLPWVVALLVILIESIGAVLIFFGSITRVASFGLIALFVGIIIKSHIGNGFFINWANAPGVGQGYEFHLLVIGMSLALLVAGGGKASVDVALVSNNPKNQ